jgi:hypothetical protein
MELIWLILALVVVDLAAILFAVDTRPGFEHSPRPWVRPGPRVEPGSRVELGSRPGP